MEEERKELEIVSGDGSNLNISRVYEHINTSRPKSNDKKPKNIIIPNSIKNEKSSNKNSELSIENISEYDSSVAEDNNNDNKNDKDDKDDNN